MVDEVMSIKLPLTSSVALLSSNDSRNSEAIEREREMVNNGYIHM